MYTKIYDRIWSMAKRRGLNTNETLLYIYLFSCPHRTLLGLYKLPLSYIAEDLGFSLPVTKKLMAGLQNKNLIEYDKTNSLVLIKKFLECNEIPNRNVEKKAVRMAESGLPDTTLWASLLEETAPYKEKLPALFDTVLKRYCQQYGKAYVEEYDKWYGNTESSKQKAEYRKQKAASSKQKGSGADAPSQAAEAAEKECMDILDECRGMFPDLTDYQLTSLRGYLEALGAEVVQEGLQKAGRNGARSWAYLDTILRDWVSNGPPEGKQATGGGAACTSAGAGSMRRELDWMDKFLSEHGSKSHD